MDRIILNVLQNEIEFVELIHRGLIHFLLKHLVKLVHVLVRLYEVRFWNREALFEHKLTKLMLIIQLFHHVVWGVQDFHALRFQERADHRVVLLGGGCASWNEHLRVVVHAYLIQLVHVLFRVLFGI